MEEQANKFFKQAIGELSDANEELCRPEEDMVTFVVCKNAQLSIINFLKGYLTKKGVKIDNLNTIDELYGACLKENKKFDSINLSEFNCTTDQIDASYCDDTNKVNRCYNTANELDTLLRAEKVI